jgi:hypothetical protein
MKVDAEGFESEIIKGGLKTINKFRPIILCEVWRKPDHINKFMQIMNDIEYEAEYIFENFPEMVLCKPR